MRDGAPLPWRVQAEHAGGGLFLDLGCHTLDMLDFILGPLEDVRGSASNVATPHLVEDGVAMTLSHRAAARCGAAQWSFASAERADEIVITGDRGELRLSTFGNEPVALRRGGERRIASILPNPPHVQQPMIQTVVDHLLGRGRCESMGVSAARTSAVIDTVLRSYYGTRDDGFWRAPEIWPGSASQHGAPLELIRARISRFACRGRERNNHKNQRNSTIFAVRQTRRRDCSAPLSSSPSCS